MGKYFDDLSDSVIEFIKQQKIFFVATAALSGEGHVNVSPKGHTDEAIVILEKNRVAYLDMTGSGVETISHIKEPGNARVTLMWTSFLENPNIVRCWGKGKAYEIGTKEFQEIVGDRKLIPGTRAVVVVDVHKVGTSCGYAVPYFTYNNERNTLKNWSENKVKQQPEHAKTKVLKDALEEYQCVRNAQSLDGLPALAQKQDKAGVHIGDALLGPPVFADRSPYVNGIVYETKSTGKSIGGIKVDKLVAPAALYLAQAGLRNLRNSRLQSIALIDLIAAALAVVPGLAAKAQLSKSTVIGLMCGLLGGMVARRSDRAALGLVLMLLASSARR